MPTHARSPFTPYPNGWFMVARSHELLPGDVKPVHYFGRELVLFRTTDGKAHVADAYCPHLGAHLGHGGCVVEDSLRCPFHGWRYEAASGRCVEIPYVRRPHPQARITTWPVDEVDQIIYVYHDEDGAPPAWRVPPLPAVDAAKWTPWREYRWPKIRTRIQDINENDVDAAHLPNLHQFTSEIPAITAEPEGPFLKLRSMLKIHLSTFGLDGTVESPLETYKYGLGIGYITQSVEVMGMTVASRSYGNTIPIDEEHVEFRLLCSVMRAPSDEATAMVERSFGESFTTTVNQDIPIWENKIHLARPLLCEGDGPIAAYRKWARQFYPAEHVAQVLRLGGGAAE